METISLMAGQRVPVVPGQWYLWADMPPPAGVDSVECMSPHQEGIFVIDLATVAPLWNVAHVLWRIPAQGIEAGGRDPEGLGAKPESPVGREADAPESFFRKWERVIKDGDAPQGSILTIPEVSTDRPLVKEE